MPSRAMVHCLASGSRLAALTIAGAIALGGASAAGPSVVVVIADDLGWGDLSRHGNPNLATPQLDRLAASGVAFARFYVQPVCAPTRAEFLTGRYAARDGVVGVSTGEERLSPAVATLADAFRAAGYATGAFGKWHNGTQAPYHPICRGFDTFYGFTSGHWAEYFDPPLDRDGRLTRGTGYLADDITTEAMRFFSDTTDRPSFTLLAFNTPHSPMQVPDRWWARHAEQVLEARGTRAAAEDIAHTRAALAMVENLDHNVGRMLDAIDRSGRADETIVAFFSDNGPNGHRFNAGMRGIKGSTDEGGVRSPLFVRWPGRIEEGRTIQTPAAAIDLAPSIAALCGIAPPNADALDGVNLAEALLGDGAAPPERTLFSNWAGRVSARRGSLVLDDKSRLYDLADDPGQTTDLARVRSDDARTLGEEVAAWQAELLDAEHASPPFDVGAPGLSITQLPVRDARLVGSLRRSNRYPNCTFAGGWASPEDAIAWDVKVVGGRYRAALYHTCNEAAVGAEVSLGWLGERHVTPLRDVHDAPLTASANDRYPRKEGDMKRFVPLELGDFNLAAGSGPLTLRVTGMPADGEIDVWLLTLERVDGR